MQHQLLNFLGKTAVITGAGGGLGRQYAVELARRGCNVVVNDVGGALSGEIGSKTDAAGAVVKDILQSGGRAIANYDSVLDGEAIIADTIKHFGTCDIIVNNAGILRDKSFHKMTKAEWRAVIDVHLNGTFELCHAAWPIMQKQQYGRIVNVGSGAGLYGNFGQANYSAAKMAIVGLTNTLAIEGEKHNIAVNCVVPVAASRMTATVLPPNVLELLSPSHVSPLVVYLAHQQCSANGEIFEVGGGWYSRVRWERSGGIALGGSDAPATAEVIQSHIDHIGDFSASTHPTSPVDAIKEMMAAAASEAKPPQGTQGGHTTASPAPSLLTGTADPSSPIGLSESRSSIPSTSFADGLKSTALFSTMAGALLPNTNNTKLVLLQKEIDNTIQFNVTHGGEKNKWVVDLRTPVAGQTAQQEPVVRRAGAQEGRAGVLIECSDDTFMKMAEGALSPEFAYMRGLLVVKGNPALAIKVKLLLNLTKP